MLKKFFNKPGGFFSNWKWSYIIGVTFIFSLLSLSIITLILVYVLESQEKNLIWEDDFHFLDDSKWTHLVTGSRGGNAEFQYYRNDRRNSFIEHGILKIKPTLAKDEMSDYDIRNGYQNLPGCNQEPCTVIANPQGDCILPVYSAALRTKDKFKFQYGRVVIRAKLPSGDWLWPTISLLPNDNSYGGWPASGAVAIVESRGNKNLYSQQNVPVGASVVSHTLHWGPNYLNNRWERTHYKVASRASRASPQGFFSDDFHIYELTWTSEKIEFKIDDIKISQISPPNGFWHFGNFNSNLKNIWDTGGKMAPFDKPFYLQISLAVGGNFFDDSFIPSDQRPWNWRSGKPLTQFYEGHNYYLKTWDHPTLEIDYIRVYKS